MPRLIHDRITWLLYAQLGTWGFFLYGFGPIVPLLRDEQGTSAAVASLHSTGLAIGSLLNGLIFPALTRRLGRDRVLWLALAGTAIAIAALCVLRPVPATLAAAVVIATFGTMVISGVNAALADHHGAAAPAAISEANAACAATGIFAPVVVGLAVSAGSGWRPALAVNVGLIVLVALAALTFRVRLPDGAPAVAAAGARPGRLPGSYWLAWILLGVTGSIETCLSLWSADVLRSHAGMSPGGASAALASIVSGMFLGRIVGGRIALRVAPAPLLLGALAVSLLGFAIFWVATVGWLAVAGLALVGLGSGMYFPLGVSMALATSGGQTDRATAYVSYAMAVGFGVAPVVLGWVADGLGPHRAFLLVPVLIATAALLALRLAQTLRMPPAARPPLVVGGDAPAVPVVNG